MTEERPGQPQPWRWMIIISRFVWTFIGLGFFKAMGVFLPYIIDSFSANTATVGVISSAVLGFGSFTMAPFVGALMKIWSARQLMMVGGALAAIGILVSAASPSISYLAVCFGVSSVGLVFVQMSAVGPIIDYFPDNFAFANGLSFAGGTTGMMVLPPVVQHLICLYGWRNALGLMGALSFNYMVCGALLRPIKRKHYSMIRGQDDSRTPTSQEGLGNVSGSKGRRSLKTIVEVLSERFDVRLLSRPSFVIFQVVSVCEGIIFCMWHLFLIPMGVEAGFGESLGAFLATFGGLGALIGRLGHGIFIDRGVIGTYSLFVLASLLFALATFVNPLAVSSYAALSVLAVVSGISIGTIYPMTFVLMRKIVGDQHMSAFSWLFVTHGAGQLIGGVLAGWIHDLSGHYESVFVAMGVVGTLMAIIVGVVRCYETYCDKEDD